MSDANNISVWGTKVADTENVTFRGGGAIFDWHHISLLALVVLLLTLNM